MAVEPEILKSLKPLVKQMYLDGGDVVKICDLFVGLNPSTVYNWISKELWAEQRNSKVQLYIETPDILMRGLDTMIKWMMEGKVKDKEGKEILVITVPGMVAQIADATAKIVKSIKSLSKDKDYLGSIVFATGKMIAYMNKQDPRLYDAQFRETLVRLITGFQSESVEIYSPQNYK